ncbi:MAG: hypothetical protein AMXMBFR82_35440 [Candidatus Hydrogenedentota bacterium]
MNKRFLDFDIADSPMRLLRAIPGETPAIAGHTGSDTPPSTVTR